MHIQEWLESAPAVSVYLLVGVVIGLESLGIPLPGEIVLVSSALLRYLAIAHYGRGRGEWKESEYPPFWRPLVVDVVVANAERLAALWRLRGDADGGERLEGELQDLLREMALHLFEELYPGALSRPARPSRP